LAGHRAFQAENVAALAYQHQHVSPPLEDIDEPLRPLVEHGLAKDPAGRPESAEAFLTELEDVALAAYGEEWDQRGRAGLGVLAVPLAALLPRAQTVAAESTTSVFKTTLGPAGKFAVTGGLVLATAAAVTSAFVIWADSPEPGPGVALPPATPSAARTQVPASPTSAAPTSAPPTSAEPTPSESITDTPPVTYAGEPSAIPTVPPVVRPTGRGPRTEPPAPTREPTNRPTTRQPTRSSQPSTRPPTSEPPATRPPTTRPPDTEPPTTRPPVTQPPTTRAPDPGTPPPTRKREPLISVSVKVSVNVPILSGEGDGLLDADVGLGLGSSLLGLVVVPGSVLVGRQMVVRRVRRRRDTEKS
ncbi:hypothetical protein AB0J09_54385, partial [Nonomuraea sp. NPDC049784]